MKTMKMSRNTILLICTAFLITACSGTIAVTYSPSSMIKGKGPVKIETFRYLPCEQGKLKANQIQNTAIGSNYMTENVDKFITEAVIKELTFVGYDVQNSSNRIVRGSINEFMSDDLGYSIRWSLTIQFDVITKAGDDIKTYSNVYTAKTKTLKGPKFFQGATTYIVRDCIEQFLKDTQSKRLL